MKLEEHAFRAFTSPGCAMNAVPTFKIQCTAAFLFIATPPAEGCRNGNPDGGSRNIASRETIEPDDVTHDFSAWKMVFQRGKWFSSVENGFSAWKMVFQRGKWFSSVENDFPAWKMVFQRGKWFFSRKNRSAAAFFPAHAQITPFN